MIAIKAIAVAEIAKRLVRIGPFAMPDSSLSFFSAVQSLKPPRNPQAGAGRISLASYTAALKRQYKWLTENASTSRSVAGAFREERSHGYADGSPVAFETSVCTPGD
jgi:hypothetical protein